MKNSIRLSVVALAVALSACGSGGGQSASQSPRPSASATPSAVPFQACSPATPCLALVKLRGSDNVVVRDVTDLDHPKTIGSLGVMAIRARFISATEVSYPDGRLYRAPLSGSPKTDVITQLGPYFDFDWSPDGKTLAYVTSSGGASSDVSSSVGTLHLVTGGRDQAMPSTFSGPPNMFVACETQECADRKWLTLMYSPSGDSIAWGQNLASPAFRVWTSTGSDITPSSVAADVPFMAVWSGSSLYFRDTKGIEVLSKGVVAPFLPGVNWIRPKGSPAGGQIVYAARDAAGVGHVYVVDTGSQSVREIAKGRSAPTYLTSRYLWYRGESNGKTYIYDLQTSTEYESIITDLYDSWPHAA